MVTAFVRPKPERLSTASMQGNGVFPDARLKQRLDQFMAGDDDVLVTATALRVMVAHGSVTPTGTDVLTKAGDDALHLTTK
jgi:hypothetical protein